MASYRSYAIGGGIGASFYLEAHATDDLDVFALLPESDRGQLTIACAARGGVVEGAHTRFGTWPVQILHPPRALAEEALRLSIETDFEGIATRVMTAEHICAICLDTGRPKDMLRVDPDIAVLLRGEHQRFLTTKLAMADVAYDVLLETGINISPLPVQHEELRVAE